MLGPTDRLLQMIEARRQNALDGVLHRPSPGGAPLGLVGFLGDIEWRQDGQAMLDAVYELDRYWREQM